MRFKFFRIQILNPRVLCLRVPAGKIKHTEILKLYPNLINFIEGGAKVSPLITALITVGCCLLVISPIAFVLGVKHRKRVAEAEIGSAEAQAQRILEDAIKSAESKKKEALIEAREEILRSKNEFDKEIKERRNEMTRQERRVASKEETLDKKTEALEKKDESLNRRIKENEEKAAEIERIKEEEMLTLQRISEMTPEQAKDKLIE